MLSRLIISFKYNGFLFMGHVQRQTHEGQSIYHVNYALFDSPSDLEAVQIYRGKGIRKRVHWRQRVAEFDPKLKDPEFVELIGEAIQIQENIESG